DLTNIILFLLDDIMSSEFWQKSAPFLDIKPDLQLCPLTKQSKQYNFMPVLSFALSTYIRPVI
ncbi:MAG: hypothetical protein ACYS30_21155, partial [Planctomycetota bacterium]